jgi:hypothetical protein
MEAEATPRKGPDKTTRVLRVIVALALGVAALGAVFAAAAYALTPAAVRHPASAHYHFRLQLIVDGRAVNFADQKFQTPFDKGVCSADLTREPFHFHDGLNQFVHVHWLGMTGGLWFKNYGWDVAGGVPGVLGYRFDRKALLAAAPIHGRVLPQPSREAEYYVYVSRDGSDYWRQSWTDFVKMDLEDFFKSKPPAPTSWLEWVVPAASAHSGHSHDPAVEAAASSEAELIRLNNVMGNVVIFAQKNEPTAEQVKARFEALVPLPESSCGG